MGRCREGDGFLMTEGRGLAVNSDIVERFFRYVNTTPTERGCLLWQGHSTKAGYGLFRVNTTRSGPRRNMTCAHRIAWEIENGPIPGRLKCLHSCDTPPCVNIKHLFVGTQKENIADARRKGRLATGERHGLRKHPESIARGEKHGSQTHPELIARGENVGTSKLTTDTVIEIRKQVSSGITQKAMSEKYKVSRATICNIMKRKVWNHIP